MVTNTLDIQCLFKNFKFKKNKPIWLNDEIIEMIVNRDDALHRAIQTKNIDDKLATRRICNLTNTAVKQIQIHKSSGITGVSAIDLIDAFLMLDRQLMYLINLSIDTCIFPNEWKVVLVVPIPKVTNYKLVSGLRPISLLP